MNLKIQTQSVLNQRKNNFLIFFTVFLLFHLTLSTSFCFSQLPVFNFKNEVLSEAIQEVSKALNIKVAFDTKAMSEYRVSGKFDGLTPNDILSQLIKNTNFLVEEKFGNYLIIPISTEKVAENNHLL